MPGGNGGKGQIYGPDGKPLITDPGARIVVIKQPRNIKFTPQQMEAMCHIAQANIITIPMDAEFLMGDIARAELLSIHRGIHSILNVPEDEKIE